MLGDLSRDQSGELREMRIAFAKHRELAPRFEKRATAPAAADDEVLRDSLRKLGYLE